MAEQDADRGDSREDDREPRVTPAAGETGAEAAGSGAAGAGAAGGGAPIDEDAAWAAIVAGYGAEPPDPPGAKPFKSIEDLALPDYEINSTEPGRESPEPAADKPLGSSVVFAPGVGPGAGPRDHELAEPVDDDLDESDEGHFVPPEPPPLPAADTTSKFAWLAVVGGPLLLLLAVLLGWPMTWWLTTLGIGGFLGGFATLIARMRQDDEENDDPGRGAVV
ncbi:hypothetical protein [Streptomyces sp. SYSU K217416]